MGKHNRHTPLQVARWVVVIVAAAIVLLIGIMYFTYDTAWEPAPPVGTHVGAVTP